MSLLASFGVKQPDGSFKNYTISIQDEVNKFGQNVSVFEEQTKEQRDAKEKRVYLGNGKVFWSDGKVALAKDLQPVGTTSAEVDSDLPF